MSKSHKFEFDAEMNGYPDMYSYEPIDPNRRTANHVIYVCKILKKLDVFENKDLHLFRSDVLEGVKRWKLSIFQSMSKK